MNNPTTVIVYLIFYIVKQIGKKTESFYGEGKVGTALMVLKQLTGTRWIF